MNRVDSIQVVSSLAKLSSQGASIGTPGTQIGFIPTETALPYLVYTPQRYFRAEDNEPLANKQYPTVWLCLGRIHPVLFHSGKELSLCRRLFRLQSRQLVVCLKTFLGETRG